MLQIKVVKNYQVVMKISLCSCLTFGVTLMVTLDHPLGTLRNKPRLEITNNRDL